jgi:hypothetical protein
MPSTPENVKTINVATTKYTPGPWKVLVGHYSDSTIHNIHATSEPFRIASIETVRGNDSARSEAVAAANANLIAAAPEMLEALKDLLCLAFPEGIYGEIPSHRHEQSRQAILEVRRVIVKAEGGAA